MILMWTVEGSWKVGRSEGRGDSVAGIDGIDAESPIDWLLACKLRVRNGNWSTDWRIDAESPIGEALAST